MKNNRYIITSFIFILLTLFLAIMKLYNVYINKETINLSAGGDVHHIYDELIYADGANIEKHFLLDNIDIPAKKLKTFKINLHTYERIDLEKESGNPVYAFIKFFDENNEIKDLKTFIFYEPIGSKLNSYFISFKNLEGFSGMVKSIMIGPFSRENVTLESIELVSDPLFDIVLFIKQSKFINIYIPAIMLCTTFLFFVFFLILANSNNPLNRILYENTELFKKIASLLLFLFILISLYFPYEIIFKKHNYFGYFHVDISSVLALSFLFTAFTISGTEKSKSKLFLYIILFFWAIHIFASFSGIINAHSMNSFLDVSINIILAPFLIFISSFLIFSKKDILHVLNALFISILFLALMSVFEAFLGFNILYNNIINYFYKPFYSFQIGNRVSSSMVHPLVYASIIILYIPIAFYHMFNSRKTFKKAITAVSMLIILTALVLTESRGALIIIFLFCIFIIIRGIIKSEVTYKLPLFLLISIVLVLFLIPATSSQRLIKRFFSVDSVRTSEEYLHRKNAFNTTYKTMLDSPLFGKGLGNVKKTVMMNSFSGKASRKISATWYTTDNYYLYILIERGIMGFITIFFPILYIIYFASLNLKGNERSYISFYLNASLILFLLHMLFLDGLNWILLYTQFYFFSALLFKNSLKPEHENKD